ncbi:MAG TPA: VOC family protein [Chloroflexota bacterium]|nr:VOC family protein [Chloroflexota bacterium]
MPKAKIRHVAISTENPRQTADWYKEVFGLEEVGTNGRDGIYLSDGEVNFAVLRIVDKQTGKVLTGVHHFGFGVDDAQAFYGKMAEVHAERQPDIATSAQYFESKFTGPDGQTVDISEHGWLGAAPVGEPEPAAAH